MIKQRENTNVFGMDFKRQTAKRAMTLLELLVVLVILAIVATIAVHSLQPRVDQARFEQTRKSLEQVKTAIQGKSNSQQPDGTPMISGFVADIGRMPRLQDPFSDPTNNPDAEPGTIEQKNSGQELCELWDARSRLAKEFPFQVRQGPSSPVDYSDVRLPCGWRGPYLDLGIGQLGVKDAWSNAFELEVGENRVVKKLVWQPVAPFEETMVVDLNSSTGTVSGTLNLEPGTTSVQTVMLVPSPEDSTEELTVLEDLDPRPEVFLFENVPIGLRALRVQAGQKKVTKYLHVPQRGLSLVIDVKD